MITVKPLEWKEGDGITCDVLYHTAETPFGLVYWQIECQWGTQGGDAEAYGDCETDEAAKSAAFEDYSARIMSAIEPAGVGVETPPPSTHVWGEPVAWRVTRYDNKGAWLDTTLHIRKPEIDGTSRADVDPLYLGQEASTHD